MLTGRGGTVRTGIPALDRSLDGIPAGGLHLLSATPGNARGAAVVQFVAAGLADGERVGLVTRSRPDRLFREAGEYGRSLEAPWREDRLALVGLRGEYEMRMRRAGSPADVFRELASLLEPMPDRLVLDPGTPLWEGRGDGATAEAFVDFVEESGATVLATTTARLEGGLSAATELVVRAARSVFQLERAPNDLVRLGVLKQASGTRGGKDLTLELVPGHGLATVGEGTGGRGGGRLPTGPRGLLLLSLGSELPEELEVWLGHRYEVRAVGEPIELVARLQADGDWGAVLIQTDREHVEEARRACRVSRRVRPGVAVVVLSGGSLRARDRAALLEDGADECISGRVNVQEFSARLDRARGGGGRRPPPGNEPAERTGGTGEPTLDAEAFRARVRDLLEAEPFRLFSVVLFRSGDPSETLEVLAGTVRGEEGDVVGPVDGVSAVLLPETRVTEAEDFAERAGRALAGSGGGSPNVEILGSQRDGAELRALIE